MLVDVSSKRIYPPSKPLSTVNARSPLNRIQMTSQDSCATWQSVSPPSCNLAFPIPFLRSGFKFNSLLSFLFHRIPSRFLSPSLSEQVNSAPFRLFTTGILGHGRSSTVLRALVEPDRTVAVAVKIFHPDFGPKLDDSRKAAKYETNMMKLLQAADIPESDLYQVQEVVCDPIPTSLLPQLVFKHIGAPIDVKSGPKWLHNSVIFLEILHHHILHRDIRMPNLAVIPDSSKILLIDFGFAVKSELQFFLVSIAFTILFILSSLDFLSFTLCSCQQQVQLGRGAFYSFGCSSQASDVLFSWLPFPLHSTR